MATTCNIAFAPLNGTNGLYDAPGVDFLHDPDIANGDETRGEAEFLNWIDYDGPEGDFNEDAADEILRAAGYARTASWDYSVGDYAQATIEPTE